MASTSVSRPTSEKGVPLKQVALAVSVVLFFSWLSSLPIAPAMVWYDALQKGPLNPPSWVFNIVWPVLYVLMTVSACNIWSMRMDAGEEVEEALALFIFQLIANFFWPLFFFGMQSTWLGMMWIGLVWILVGMTTIFFYSISRLSAAMMVPYWLWVSFAAYLNYMLWQLNG